ncbi:hypothetical protein GCM10023195_18450 [Actinoallomurus liliacearum]|uniref:MFS transporter n=1 Tax=Actinoallomurus liliacearum TaxID=1080073 RepID=A0ABP8TGC5_9ACTN
MFVSSGAPLHDPYDRDDGLRPSPAWRSAMARQRNLWSAVSFWAFSTLLVMYDVLDRTLISARL